MQPDTTGDPALEDEIKAFIHVRDDKPGNVFLGVVHRIDRPVSGAVLFAKTGKALTRMNELVKNREIRKIYWALTENRPQQPEGELVHHLARDGKTNKSRVYDRPTAGSKEARLRYRLLGSGTHYHLLEIELLTGRHHQIRAQLSKIGCPIRGDLKYGAARSNRDGSMRGVSNSSIRCARNPYALRPPYHSRTTCGSSPKRSDKRTTNKRIRKSHFRRKTTDVNGIVQPSKIGRNLPEDPHKKTGEISFACFY